MVAFTDETMDIAMLMSFGISNYSGCIGNACVALTLDIVGKDVRCSETRAIHDNDFNPEQRNFKALVRNLGHAIFAIEVYCYLGKAGTFFMVKIVVCSARK